MLDVIKDPLPEIDLERVAYALAGHIARGHIAADPALKKLDEVGRMSAAHTMAQRMAPDLKGEVEVVLDEVRRQLRAIEWKAAEACMAAAPEPSPVDRIVQEAERKQAAYEKYRAEYREANPIVAAGSETRFLS